MGTPLHDVKIKLTFIRQDGAQVTENISLITNSYNNFNNLLVSEIKKHLK